MKYSLRSKTLGRFPYKIMFLFVQKSILADCRSFTLSVGCNIRMIGCTYIILYYIPMYRIIILFAPYPWSLPQSNAVFHESAPARYGLM
jgi:hypothetical protein